MFLYKINTKYLKVQGGMFKKFIKRGIQEYFRFPELDVCHDRYLWLYVYTHRGNEENIAAKVKE